MTVTTQESVVAKGRALARDRRGSNLGVPLTSDRGLSWLQASLCLICLVCKVGTVITSSCPLPPCAPPGPGVNGVILLWLFPSFVMRCSDWREHSRCTSQPWLCPGRHKPPLFFPAQLAARQSTTQRPGAENVLFCCGHGSRRGGRRRASTVLQKVPEVSKPLRSDCWVPPPCH